MVAISENDRITGSNEKRLLLMKQPLRLFNLDILKECVQISETVKHLLIEGNCFSLLCSALVYIRSFGDLFLFFQYTGCM